MHLNILIRLDFKDYIETSKINFRKNDFKIRISDTPAIISLFKTYEKNKIKFRYKIYGKNLIEKLSKTIFKLFKVFIIIF